METTGENGSLLTAKIIGCAFQVHNILGSGFLEKVYENALAKVLRDSGLRVQQQIPLKVIFENTVVGEYIADMVVQDTVIVELKVASRIEAIHEMQLVNYLKATGIKLGLVINFGTKVEVRRKINSKR
ncbi:MAG: GxxExxY protein [Spirochaetales bacterium]|nr:GxxExxY protein [Spirochaetales bacterium]